MKKIIISILALSSFASAFAGNRDRSGQAAASELLVNPWAATGGMFGMNAASVNGLEAMKLNIAGLASLKGSMEVGASHNTYLVNTGIQIYNAGFAYSLNKRSKFGVNLMNVDYGTIPVTSVNNPQGIAGSTFKPQFFNISLGYAYKFGRNIDAGLNFTYVNEGVSNARASAAGFDAGIMYTTGLKDEVHFGITLRNVGSNIRFAGDGLTYSSTSIDDQDKTITVSNISQRFQLPTQLNIAAAYDLYLGSKNLENNLEVVGELDSAAATSIAAENKLRMKSDKRLTFNASFISNSFINDYLGVGAEFALKESFFLRAGYRYESGIWNIEKKTTLFNGIAAGAGFAFNLNKDKSRKVILDYAYKPSSLGAVHTVGVRLVN
jgi:hypothetical protein